MQGTIVWQQGAGLRADWGQEYFFKDGGGVRGDESLVDVVNDHLFET
jgi:hypothetical protein